MATEGNSTHREPWNKGKIVGQKAPFKVQDIWALRVRLQMEGRVRDLALFNLGTRLAGTSDELGAQSLEAPAKEAMVGAGACCGAVCTRFTFRSKQ